MEDLYESVSNPAVMSEYAKLAATALEKLGGRQHRRNKALRIARTKRKDHQKDISDETGK